MSIRVENITYTYGGGTPYEKTALENVDLTIEKENLWASSATQAAGNPR